MYALAEIAAARFGQVLLPGDVGYGFGVDVGQGLTGGGFWCCGPDRDVVWDCFRVRKFTLQSAPGGDADVWRARDLDVVGGFGRHAEAGCGGEGAAGAAQGAAEGGEKHGGRD